MTSDQLKRATFYVLVLFSVSLSPVLSQGGPPMITNNPGTPGPNKWEINLAVDFEHRPDDQTLFDLPVIDLNYGVGEHIQLSLQNAPRVLKREDHGAIGGLGETQAGLKWRFLDEDKSGFDVSMFPRVIFNITQSSVRRGLSDDGTRFQVPFQIAKSFGRCHVAGEFGPRASSVGRSEFLYGIVGGFDVAKETMVEAEFAGTSRTNFTRDSLAVNFGIKQTLTEHCILIASLGHEVRAPDDQPLAFIGYFGVQLLY